MELILFWQQVHNANIQRAYFVFRFSNEAFFSDGINLMKKNGGAHKVYDQYSLFNSVTKEAEMYLKCEQIRCRRIIAALKQQAGAKSIQVTTFSCGTGGQIGALHAYNRITEGATREGFRTTHLGPERLRGAWCTDEKDEYDVVKKRKKMDAADSATGEDDDQEALIRFQDFEESTLPALMAVHALDQEIMISERLQMEEDFANGIVSKTGGVYMAKTDAFDFVKIGATRRSDPHARLYELSRCVPSPFRLVYWIPTERPFALERKIHHHYAKERIRVKGAGTEFFNLSSEKMLEFTNV